MNLKDCHLLHMGRLSDLLEVAHLNSQKPLSVSRQSPYCLPFFYFSFLLLLLFGILGLHLQHVEVPRLGVELELQLPAYTTATATPDPSHICDPHSSQQPHQSFGHFFKWPSVIDVCVFICPPLSCNVRYIHYLILNPYCIPETDLLSHGVSFFQVQNGFIGLVFFCLSFQDHT